VLPAWSAAGSSAGIVLLTGRFWGFFAPQWRHDAPITSAREDDVYHFFLKITLVGRRPLWCVVELLPQDIASEFVGRFSCDLQRFFSVKKSPFQTMEKFGKLSLDGATIGARIAEKNKNLRKWVQSLCAPFRPFRSEVKEKYYHSILPHVQLMCTRIKNFR